MRSPETYTHSIGAVSRTRQADSGDDRARGCTIERSFAGGNGRLRPIHVADASRGLSRIPLQEYVVILSRLNTLQTREVTELAGTVVQQLLKDPVREAVREALVAELSESDIEMTSASTEEPTDGRSWARPLVVMSLVSVGILGVLVLRRYQRDEKADEEASVNWAENETEDEEHVPEYGKPDDARDDPESEDEAEPDHLP